MVTAPSAYDARIRRIDQTRCSVCKEVIFVGEIAHEKFAQINARPDLRGNFYIAAWGSDIENRGVYLMDSVFRPDYRSGEPRFSLHLHGKNGALI